MLNTLIRQTKFFRHGVIVKGRYKATKPAYEVSKRIRMADAQSPRSRADPVILKLDSLEFYSLFTPELQTLADLFKKYNYELRIAGGAVRDILMDIQPTDLDFATDATPKQMIDMFTQEEVRMINESGEKHGTITARINNKENFEITTLRIDVVTNGRHAEVEYTKDWKRDANRRDLTINSMFLDLDGKVHDYFYGYDDLQKKRIVFVGDADVRIQEDYLRILRYFRFYGRISDKPDEHDKPTIKAIKENINGLSRISGERIWSEWNKILSGNFGLEMTLKLIECGGAVHIGLPKEPDVENFRVVCERALSKNISLKPISLIASMLKDENEVMKLHARLKLSNLDRDLALFLIQHREYKPCEKPLKPYQQLVVAQNANKCNVYREYVKEVLKYRGAVQLLNEFEQWVMPKFPINGNALKERVPDRRIMGDVIIELKKIWVDQDFKLNDVQLLDFIPNILSEIKNEDHYLKKRNKPF